MSKQVPLIRSGTAGPLGVLHLPRFWQKVSLDAAGKLAAGYPACGAGYDQMVLDGLGLDKGASVVVLIAFAHDTDSRAIIIGYEVKIVKTRGRRR